MKIFNLWNILKKEEVDYINGNRRNKNLSIVIVWVQIGS